MVTQEMVRESVFFDVGDGDVEKASAYGRMRNDAKDVDVRSHESGYHKSGIQNIFGVDSGERCYPHIIGIYWEIVFGRHMGWEVNFEALKSGDKIDFHGTSVKAVSKGRKPRVIVKVHDLYKKPTPKWYVLGIVDPMDAHQIECFGMVSRDRFMENMRVYPAEEGRETSYYVDGFELRTVNEMILQGAYEEAKAEAEAEAKRIREIQEAEKMASARFMGMVEVARKLKKKKLLSGL